MASIHAELTAASQAFLRWNFVELILVAIETEVENSRTDICGHELKPRLSSESHG